VNSRVPHRRSKKKELEELIERLRKVEEELAALRHFRRTRQTENHERHLHGERSNVKQQIRKIEGAEIEKPARKNQAEANRNRSEKNKRNWRYVNSIAYNYKIPPKKVRSELKKKKKGLQSDIDDVIWRNPSP
jgi:hypothetical protein